MEKKSYYSRRNRNNKVDLILLKELFENIYYDSKNKAFFYDSFGCNQNGWYHTGKLGDDDDINRLLLIKLRKSNLWPISECIIHYEEEDLFDIIEFCYDNISIPNDLDNADINYTKKEFRDNINEHLRDYEDGFELDKNGEIVPLTLFGLKNIHSADIPCDDMENVVKPITDAVKKFRDRHSSGEDRKDAVRELADVLEFLKKSSNLMELLLSKKDESDLFNIINNFHIRHHNKTQKKDYDKGIWHTWMFYFYLATIHAVLRYIKKR